MNLPSGYGKFITYQVILVVLDDLVQSIALVVMLLVSLMKDQVVALKITAQANQT